MVHGAATRTGYGGSAVDLRLLVARAQKGDRSALEELYLLHFDRIYGYLHVVPEVDEEPSAEAQALDSITRFGMLELIDRLSPEQRQVVTLKFFYGFQNSETAGILGKSENAVKSLQHRALASLEKQLVHS